MIYFQKQNILFIIVVLNILGVKEMKDIKELKESHNFLLLCKEVDIRKELMATMVGELYPSIVQQEIHDISERIRVVLVAQRIGLTTKFFNDVRDFLRQIDPGNPNLLHIEEVNLKNTVIFVFSGSIEEKAKAINEFSNYLKPILKYYQQYNFVKISAHFDNVFIFSSVML